MTIVVDASAVVAALTDGGPDGSLPPAVTAYDAAHVALAEALDAPLWALDRRLALAPGPRCAFRLPQP